MQLANFAAHLGSQLGVEVGERFVKQKHLRAHRAHRGDGHHLALAAREILRQALQ